MFPQFLMHLLSLKQTLLFASPWGSPEAIHMLEGRAVLKAVQHACRTPACRMHRVLFLCDNMSIVMAFNKGRCRDLRVLRLCRRTAAFCLSHGVSLRLRYVESSRNPADGPTRPHREAEGLGVSDGDRYVRKFVPPPGLEQEGAPERAPCWRQ
jgi:hypothetical protein